VITLDFLRRALEECPAPGDAVICIEQHADVEPGTTTTVTDVKYVVDSKRPGVTGVLVFTTEGQHLGDIEDANPILN